jgi:N-methylhydantoinase B/oxoprolinase/acetone carboxylase alpha subunit
MREKWHRDWSEFEPSRIFAMDSIAEWFQMAEEKKRGINLKLARIEAKVAQLQAMKALVRELPKFTTHKKCSNNVEEIVDATTKFQWEVIKRLATEAQEVEDKGKGKAQEVEDKGKGKGNVIEVEDDDWGDDELLFDFESE